MCCTVCLALVCESCKSDPVCTELLCCYSGVTLQSSTLCLTLMGCCIAPTGAKQTACVRVRVCFGSHTGSILAQESVVVHSEVRMCVR